MNVSKLARQLNVSTKELLEKLPELGFSVGQRAIKIDDRQVDKIMAAWKRDAKLKAIKQQHENITEVRGKQDDQGKGQREVTVGSEIVVKDLADQMGIPLQKVMAEMMKNGIMASLNERLDFETASIIAEDLGFKVVRSENEGVTVESQKEKLKKLLADRQSQAQRPPVVVVMGHVDHGKTRLLDAIRKTNVIDGEAGGITQHIGAYQVDFEKDGKERTITFLDTPGHEAFKAMRSRGGQVADVAILVVAADDGLQPQTLESLAIIQKEGLPFIVAINKIDKEEADIEKIKGELAEINLTPEDWGGKTITVPISAKQEKNIEDVLDMVLLVADMEELKADDSGQAVGTIIESHMDRHEGPVATVLVQAGTLKVNDMFTVGSVVGKIKSLKTWKGEDVQQAKPGTPVKILGLKGVAQVGDILQVSEDKKAFRKALKSQPKKTSLKTSVTASSSSDEEKTIPTLNLVIKADVLGSLEAIEESLNKLNSDKAQVKIVKKGLGFVTESDVLTAESSDAILISFHLKNPRTVESLIQDKNVNFLQFDIIYKLLEDIEARLKEMKAPEIVRNLLGKLEVLAVFKESPKATILGGKVVEGKIKNPSLIKVIRNGEVITFGNLADLESNKEKMTEVVEGNEAGLKFEGEPVIQAGDTLEFFEEKNVS